MTASTTLPPAQLQQLLQLFQARRYDAMERLARDLLQRQPGAGMGWKALGIALQAQGQDARAALRQALALLPGDAELRASLVDAHLRHGHAALKAGDAARAADSYRAAQDVDASHPHAPACLGVAQQELGQAADAAHSFARAVALRPDLASSHFGLGYNLLALGRPSDALASLRRVLELAPDHASAHANAGNALKALGRLDEALPHYRRAIELQPDVALHQANLGAACRELGRMAQALACYQCAFALAPQRLDYFSDALFIRDYLPGDAPPTRAAEARRFGALASARAQAFAHAPPAARAGARLRVGFVSADLREHPVGHFFESVLAALAGMAVDPFVYANTGVEDALTARLRAHCAHWTSIAALDDAAAATRIHADRLDVLVDLSGHTAGNRLPLFAWRPAPLQVTWLGDCGTTGLAEMDHWLADPWIAPPGIEARFSERPWRLPETFLCFTPPRDDVPVGPPPALAQGHVTFGCFNKLAKLDDAVVAAWARVLAAVPRSRLLLKSGALAGGAAREGIVDRFAAHGVAAERLTLEGPSSRADYLRAYGRVDIALDPFPYPGGTTSVEGFWMGVPVLTLAGASALGRQGVSLLRNLELPEWIASDVDDYVARAARHAGDLGALAVLRGGLRGRLLASPLCDAPRFATHLLQALQAMEDARRAI